MEKRVTIGTVTDAMHRYGLDAAAVWYHLTGDRPIERNGRLVRIEADPEKRQGSLWIIEEIEIGEA